MSSGGIQEDACEIAGLRTECGLRALQVEQLMDKIAQLRKQYDDMVIRHTEQLKTKDEAIAGAIDHISMILDNTNDYMLDRTIRERLTNERNVLEQALKGEK